METPASLETRSQGSDQDSHIPSMDAGEAEMNTDLTGPTEPQRYHHPPAAMSGDSARQTEPQRDNHPPAAMSGDNARQTEPQRDNHPPAAMSGDNARQTEPQRDNHPPAAMSGDNARQTEPQRDNHPPAAMSGDNARQTEPQRDNHPPAAMSGDNARQTEPQRDNHPPAAMSGDNARQTEPQRDNHPPAAMSGDNAHQTEPQRDNHPPPPGIAATQWGLRQNSEWKYDLYKQFGYAVWTFMIFSFWQLFHLTLNLAITFLLFVKRMANAQIDKPVVPNEEDDSPSDGATAREQQMVGQTTPTSQARYHSENGHPICQPSGDEMAILQDQHCTLETAAEELDAVVLDPQEMLMSNSSCTTEDDTYPVRFPVEWDSQNNLRISRDICKLMTQNPKKIFRVTPCSKIKVEIGDPSCYLVDSGYNETTCSAWSQQPGQSATGPVTGGMGPAGFQQHPRDPASNPQCMTTGPGGEDQPFNRPIIQLESLSTSASPPAPTYEVHKDGSHDIRLITSSRTGSPQQCDVTFAHEGYAMFHLTVPRGIRVNTLIEMRQFSQQKRALLGEKTCYFLRKGLINMTEIQEDSIINIETL